MADLIDLGRQLLGIRDVIVIGVVGDRDGLAGVSLNFGDVGVAGNKLQGMHGIKKRRPGKRRSCYRGLAGKVIPEKAPQRDIHESKNETYDEPSAASSLIRVMRYFGMNRMGSGDRYFRGGCGGGLKRRECGAIRMRGGCFYRKRTGVMRYIA